MRNITPHFLQLMRIFSFFMRILRSYARYLALLL